MNDLRKKLRKENAKYRVVKNTILRKVLSEKDFKSLEASVDGQCGVTISSGEVSSVSKVLMSFAKENESFEVKTLYFDSTVYDAKQVKALATLPSREELLAKVCGGMKSPIQGVVGVLSGVMRNMVSVINQIKEKQEKK